MNYEIYVLFLPLIASMFLSLLMLPRMRMVGRGMDICGMVILPLFLIVCFGTICAPRALRFLGFSGVWEQPIWRIIQITVGASWLYIVGMKHDYHGAGTGTRLLGLLLAVMMFPMTELWINNLEGLFGIYAIPAWIGIPLTMLFAIYIIEVITLMDDIDGLGTGIIAVLASVFLIFSIVFRFALGGIVSATTFGIAASFVLLKLFSRKWRKVVVGHSGSYVLGYILSYMALSSFRQAGISFPEGMLLVTLGVLLVPAFDILRVLKVRVRENRSLILPDRNQIQHRLYRTGMSRWMIPICIISLVFFFGALNSWWVMTGRNLTLLFVIDILLWLAFQSVISYSIRSNETRNHREAWKMEYGREAWEADTPVEVIKKKQETFGTMGLPENVIMGTETEFIPDGMNGFERATKRLFDFCLSGLLIIIFSPLFLLSYILIKLDDGGPAIFRQERLGRFGRPFYILKYRSMRLDAEKMGPQLSHAGGDDDPRLTKVGKFLRAHHLDELPQLLNVFRGEMSFIGYRPERKFFIDKIMQHDPRYSFLYQIRPGVTSYATLYNGYTDTMEKMLRRLDYDLYYLEHRSWMFDCKVLFLTFISIIFGKKF